MVESVQSGSLSRLNSHFFKSKNRLLLLLFRALLFASLLFVFMQYVGMMNTQSQSFDVARILDLMREKQTIHELGRWSLTLSRCSVINGLRRCEGAGGNSSEMWLRFPDPTGVKQLTGGDRKINQADLVYSFSDEDKLWLRKRRDAVLVFPRSVQKSLQVSFGSQNLEVSNTGSVVLPLDLRNRTADSNLLVSIDFEGLSLFGPAELPVVLADPGKATDEFLTLEKRLNFGKEIASRMEIGFPLLLAAVAIVLDHSIAFGLLSLFAMAFATRSYIAFSVSHGAAWNVLFNYLYIVSNALVSGFLILFVLSMVGLLPRRLLSKIGLLLLLVALAFVFVELVPDGLFRLDLVFDAASCSFGIFAAVSGLALFLWQRRLNQTNGTGLNPFEVHPFLKIAQVAGLSLVLAIHCFVNFSELFASSNIVEKNFLDWRHSVLFPGLLAVALVEMGSVTRKIHRVARGEAQRAVLEREMAMGRAVQGRMLGSRKSGGEGWLARAFFAPAVELAGDWYHVFEVGFSDGKSLVAATIADVTGHGVSAALVTSVLRSQWGQWVRDAALRSSPQDDAERERELSSLLKSLDAGVRALGHGDCATAALVLLCPSTGRFSYCTAAHPSIFRADDLSGSESPLKSIRTQSPQIGSAFETNAVAPDNWKCKSDCLEYGEYLCLYSDGLSTVLPGEGKSLMREIQRRRQERGWRYARVMLERMRLVRRHYRGNLGVEDDITLLLLWRLSGENKVS